MIRNRSILTLTFHTSFRARPRRRPFNVNERRQDIERRLQVRHRPSVVDPRCHEPRQARAARRHAQRRRQTQLRAVLPDRHSGEG